MRFLCMEYGVRYGRQASVTHNSGKPTWRGPLKTLRLLILVALLPALFIAVPLYLRYRVFSGQLYPVGMSDMRLIDKKVSTTWCQRQILRSNATFNAFLVPSQPVLANKLVPVTMTRHLLLDDDMKEYWGFYLLQGSIVTVAACVRWPGASLIMIRGHRHLQECAYIGDDSSEELEEILEANGGKLDNDTIMKLTNQPTNKPGNMIRQLGEIRFHEPRPNHDKHHHPPRAAGGFSEEKDHPDALVLKNILGELRSRQEKTKSRTAKIKHEHIITVPQLKHRYRETNVNEDEEKWLSFKDLEPHSEQNEMNQSETVVQKNTSEIHSNSTNTNAQKVKSKSNEDSIIIKEVPSDPKEDQTTSSEIYEDILQKLTKLGSRGEVVLDRLNDKFNSDIKSEQINETVVVIDDILNDTATFNSTSSESLSKEEIADQKLQTLKHLLIEILEEQKQKKKAVDKKNPRTKRQIVLSPAMIVELNEDDEKGNAAIEEGFEPDEFADHHSVINETTPNDMSKSEFWSSFSSSEEALLECKGLILNLPLTPHKECVLTNTESDHERAALSNTITYRVPTNGYYFFVFNSENEIQTNYIRVKFDLQKTIYDLTKGTVTECKNSTGNCTIPLSFFSTEKVVLEVPLRDNDSLWNEEFVVMSECEPRTAIYLVCVITVPMLIVFLAFQ
ncbi:uncharacterized protein LOC143918385 isoform X2 [Arctopsyche grandis]|uniref:uncharacterized protein LOC143918385 isoform X2 n=1 Tax=Arctopsyche grandis TaxID=121162 RepID=UPI00406D990A